MSISVIIAIVAIIVAFAVGALVGAHNANKINAKAAAAKAVVK